MQVLLKGVESVVSIDWLFLEQAVLGLVPFLFENE